METAVWLYVSVSKIAKDLVDAELARIVDWSHRNNAAMNVSGALLFTGVRFLQCIEGSPKAVKDIRAKIMYDPRHEAVTTLIEGPIVKRQFENWSLAYVGPSMHVSTTINRAIREAGLETGQGGETLKKLLFELASRHKLGAPL